MSLYDQPLRGPSLRDLHHQEQVQNKIRQQTDSDVATALTTVFTAELTPASVTANSHEEQAFTVSGVTTDMDLSMVRFPLQSTRVTAEYAYVSAADEVTISFFNDTAGAVTPTSGEFKFLAVR